MAKLKALHLCMLCVLFPFVAFSQKIVRINCGGIDYEVKKFISSNSGERKLVNIMPFSNILESTGILEPIGKSKSNTEFRFFHHGAMNGPMSYFLPPKVAVIRCAGGKWNIAVYLIKHIKQDSITSKRYAGFKKISNNQFSDYNKAYGDSDVIQAYKKIDIIKEKEYPWAKLLKALDEVGLFDGVSQSIMDSLVKAKHPELKPIPTTGFFVQVKIGCHYRNIIYKGHYRYAPDNVAAYAKYQKLLNLFYNTFTLKP